MANVYKIGIEIAMSNGVSAVLGIISKELLGVNAKVKEIEKNFGLWQVAAGGAMAAFVGFAGLDLTKHIVTNGAELLKQAGQLKALGFDNRTVAEATVSAQKTVSQVIGTNRADNVKYLREITGVMPSIQAAEGVLPDLLKGATVLQQMSGKPIDQSVQTLAKAIELRGGGIDPKTRNLSADQFRSEVNEAVKTIIATGGLIDAQQLYGLMQQAGPMARMTDASTFYNSIMTAVMDMGGRRAGTALTAIGRQMLGGKMQFPTAEEMGNLGWLQPGSYHREGGGTYVEPGDKGLVGYDTMSKMGFMSWMDSIGMPLMLKHLGLDANNPQSVADPKVMQELYRVFGTETARRIAALMIQNAPQVQKDIQIRNQAQGLDAYDTMSNSDLGLNVKGLQGAMESLFQTLGESLVPTAISALQTLTRGINDFTSFLADNPTLASFAAKALAISSGVLAIGGSLVALGAMVAISRGSLAAIGIGGSGATAAGAAAGAVAGAAKNWTPGVGPVVSGGPGFFGNLMRGVGAAWAYDAGKSTIDGLLTSTFGEGGKGGAAPDLGFGQLKTYMDRFQQDSGVDIGKVFQSIGTGIKTGIDAIPGEIAPSLANLRTIGGTINADIMGLSMQVGSAINASVSGIAGFFNSEIGKLPGEVAGAIGAAFGAIGGEISKGISGALSGAEGKALQDLKKNGPIGIGADKMNFVAPPRSEKPIVINTALNVDGRTMARNVSYHLAKRATHPTQAPYPDGRAGYWAPDMQVTST